MANANDSTQSLGWPAIARRYKTIPQQLQQQVFKMITHPGVPSLYKRVLTRWLSSKEDITSSSTLESAVKAGYKAVYGTVLE
jgi:hypothetical protein